MLERSLWSWFDIFEALLRLALFWDFWKWVLFHDGTNSIEISIVVLGSLSSLGEWLEVVTQHFLHGLMMLF